MSNFYKIIEVDPTNHTTGETEIEVVTKEGYDQLMLNQGLSEVTVIKLPLYEYRDIWAEEGSTLTANSAEWSFGNGSTGFIGLPIDKGWEVEAMYFHADSFSANAVTVVDLINYGDTPSNAAGNTISSIIIKSATDGGGQVNNGYKYQTFDTPVPIPVTGESTVIGFITRQYTASIGDARVGARLRRKIGEYISDIKAVPGEENGPVLTECTDMKVTFENIQQFAFGWGIVNGSTEDKNWVYVIRGANFKIDPNQITNNQDFEYRVLENNNGTLDHYFKSIISFPGETNKSYEWRDVNLGQPAKYISTEFKCS